MRKTSKNLSQDGVIPKVTKSGISQIRTKLQFVTTPTRSVPPVYRQAQNALLSPQYIAWPYVNKRIAGNVLFLTHISNMVFNYADGLKSDCAKQPRHQDRH